MKSKKQPLLEKELKDIEEVSSSTDSQKGLRPSKKTKPNSQRQRQKKKQSYTQQPPQVYPVNIIKELLFSWTIRLFRIANKNPLKTIHLGRFSDDFSPLSFLKQILPTWEKINKSKTSKPLIKSLLTSNFTAIIYIILLSVIASMVDISMTILFRQVLLHFQDEGESRDDIYFSFLNTVLLMLLIKLMQIFMNRFFEFYTAKIGAKITIQVNTLLYNKLLRISTFAQYSEGELINFIQIDAEKFADFFSYSPGTLVLPIEIGFNIYLLFTYFGPSFLVGMLVLLVIFIISSILEIQRLKYQKDILALKDRRIKTSTQAFDTIKIVKLYSWEDYYMNKIKEERKEELNVVRKIQMNSMIINSLFWATGGLISLLSIITYNISDANMEISNILTSIFIFNNIGEPLFLFPEYITGLFDSLVSLKRIEGFLNGKEWNESQVDQTGNDNEFAVKIDNLDFGVVKKTKHHNHELKLLKNITLKAKYGDLIGLVGDVGSGKTCLINAILNNLDILNNAGITNPKEMKRIIINGSISYVSQNPWILNETLRNNILFFQELDETKYNRIVDICQLRQDFALLSGGDFTEIGDKGLNLSGGQRARIAIARALYSDSDIYLFDDPLSALDAYVGMSIFEKVISEYLKGKTVIIATHALQYIPFMNHVVHLKDGQIDWCGTGEEATQKEFYSKFCKTIKKKTNEYHPSEPLNELCDTEVETKHHSTFLEINLSNRGKSRKKSIKKLTREDDYRADNEMIDLHSFISLFEFSGGIFFLLFVLVINVSWKTCETGSDYVLTYWSVQKGLNRDQNLVFLIIYSCITFLAICFIFSRTVVVVNGIIKYNKKMHDELIKKLLQAPINLFHDMVPRGQILNRLSKDLDNTVKFFWTFNASFRLMIQLISCVIICICFNWYSLVFFPFLFYVQYKIYLFYINGARDLNRLEGSTRSSILSGFSETMNGIVTIRGYEYQERFRKKYHLRLDDFFKVIVYQNGCSNWFALNLDLVSFVLLYFVLSFAIAFKKYISADAMGLLLSYTLKLIDYTFNFFEQYTQFQRFMTSLERCDAFTQIVQEKSFVEKNDEYLKQIGFPREGTLKFINYSVRYRPDTEVVLKNLNFSIEANEKIGVVGRTGSGKSTLCLCCFRILEPYLGKILIDDVDITTIGLKFLRNILTVIPQDPTLIEGTLRENLDPIGSFSDEELTKEVNTIGIGYMLTKKGLDFQIKEGGKNISVGERQLICITRAILRKSKIVIMDEATSAIDYKTEMLIQNSISQSLKYSTVITIAHRIKTIINYDRIFVLQNGELVECGKPNDLIKGKKGIFYELYLQSNI